MCNMVVELMLGSLSLFSMLCCLVKEEDGISVVLLQAEDGIRDLVRSRGLGDVYKRQVGKGRA